MTSTPRRPSPDAEAIACYSLTALSRPSPGAAKKIHWLRSGIVNLHIDVLAHFTMLFRTYLLQKQTAFDYTDEACGHGDAWFLVIHCEIVNDV